MPVGAELESAALRHPQPRPRVTPSVTPARSFLFLWLLQPRPPVPSLRPPPLSGAAAASIAVMSAPAGSRHPAASTRIPPKLGGAAALGVAAGPGPAQYQQNGEAGEWAERRA